MVPEIAEYLHYCWKKSLKRYKEFIVYMLENSCRFDRKADNLFSEYQDLRNRAMEESKRLISMLNKKARELGLELPYPEQR